MRRTYVNTWLSIYKENVCVQDYAIVTKLGQQSFIHTNDWSESNSTDTIMKKNK